MASSHGRGYRDNTSKYISTSIDYLLIMSLRELEHSGVAKKISSVFWNLI